MSGDVMASVGMTRAYTDGACAGNPGGRGGWAVVILGGGEFSGSHPSTTNNRMELQAAIEALRRTTGPVVIVSDSKYVVEGASAWIRKWKSNGWRVKKHRAPVKNQDLWQAIDAAMADRLVRWEWVRGHNGDPHNERCDELANAEAGIGVDAHGVDWAEW
jgi:ribonuclease HI